MIDFTNRKIILLCLTGLIIVYLIFTNWVETKEIYPEEKEWFDLNVWAYATNDSCLDYGQSSIYYYNDPERYWYKGDWDKNLVVLDLNIRKICDFGQLKISVSATNLSFLITYAENKTALEINKTNQSKFDLLIDNNESEFFYRVQLIIPINHDFFNYYRFTSPKIPINVVTFSYRDSVFRGYSASESSFTIFNSQKNYAERPIRSDKYKWYDFDNEQGVLLNFTPKSRLWLLIQKMIDAIVLGLIAVGLYELLPRSKPNIKKKNS